MITLTNTIFITNERSINEYIGLSTDDKPTGELNGSSFYEMDTQKMYYYDEDTDTWVG